MVAALLCYIIMAGVVLYPASITPFFFIVGHEQATAGCHVWVLWWAQQGLSQIETDLIFYPYGGDVMKLYGSDILSPLLLSWIPISPVYIIFGFGSSWFLVRWGFVLCLFLKRALSLVRLWRGMLSQCSFSASRTPEWNI